MRKALERGLFFVKFAIFLIYRHFLKTKTFSAKITITLFLSIAVKVITLEKFFFKINFDTLNNPLGVPASMNSEQR